MSARGCEPRHQPRTGAALLAGVHTTDVVVDTGCNRTLLPEEFKRYAVGKPVGKGSTIELGGKGQELHVSPLTDVLLPVYDDKGQQRLLKEQGVFSKEARYPLLASMYRPTSLLMPGVPERVQGMDEKGNTFWIPWHRKRR